MTEKKEMENQYESKTNEKQQDMIREQQIVYGTSAEKTEYTIEDYFALPEDQRAELIDGVFYDMATPLNIHQGIAGMLHHELMKFREKKKGSCMPMIAPIGVQLDCDNKTVVEPDVIIVCDRSKFRKRVVYGAPDFVAEVLSPSTRKKDMTLKYYKYANAGVREYWIIDPQHHKVIVYYLEEESAPVIYGFEDTVPVGIWDGECKIDFAAMMREIGFLE